MKKEFLSLALSSVMFIGTPLSGYAMEEGESLANDYSDHTLMTVEKPLRINNLNIAQLGRLQLFSTTENEVGFNFSSTLRTPHILKLLHEKRAELEVLGKRLLDILKNSELTLASKNERLALESEALMSSLKALGFDVKAFTMVPLKLFNPEVSPTDLWKTPDLFIKGPAYMLEDSNSYLQRMELAYEALFRGNPDVATAQEIELGESDGIFFSEVFSQIMEKYPSYGYDLPDMSGRKMLTTSLTFFNKEVFKDISKENSSHINNLRARLKYFQAAHAKVQIHTLNHLQSNQTISVLNMHAEYYLSNTPEPWGKLRSILDEASGVIVAGDFNLKLENKQYFEKAMEGYEGTYQILQTPEPVEYGNPTYDIILLNPMDPTK